MTTLSEKLSLVSQEMQKREIDAFIIPSADAHKSEYVAEKDKRREWISNFTGSAGTALVVKDSSTQELSGYLWTDGRYFTQAAQELDSNYFSLMKMGQKDVPKLSEFIKPENLKSLVNKDLPSVGIDPTYVSIDEFKRFNFDFKLCRDLIDDARQGHYSVAPHPKAEVFVFDDIYAGKSSMEKLRELRALYKEDFILVLTDLAEVCWLTNLRGRYFFECNPVFFAYAIVTQEKFILFSDEVTELSSATAILPYKGFETTLEKLLQENQSKLFLPLNANYAVFEICMKAREEQHIQLIDSPVSIMKAVKNDTEIAQMKESHIIDAVALCDFLCQLEKDIVVNKKAINEWEASALLLKSRQQSEHFEDVSFDTISSYGPNGAIIHYKPTEKSSNLKTIGTDNLYLLDSGGQYKIGGTTDITRTMHFGEPTAEQKKFYTLVLEGHANFAGAKFPDGTPGYKLGTLARYPLWEHEADYRHGTGHGVGCFLNVHEFPPSISAHKILEVDVNVLKPGHIISNEPGYYKVDDFGIRIENLVVVEKTSPNSSFCQFETISLVPIQTKLIDTTLVTDRTKRWLNEYHRAVLDVVGARLLELGKGETYEWLKENTKPI